MHKQTWWMAVVVLGALSLLGCSKKTATSTPDAGKVAVGTGGTSSGIGGASGSSAGAGGTAGRAPMTSIAQNVPCGDNMCAGSAPTMVSMTLGPNFMVAQPCCLDMASGKCGSVQTDMSCMGSPPPDPNCPALFMGLLTGCCATGNLCGVDATLMGRGCVDLKTVGTMIPAQARSFITVPSPLNCDGTPVAMPEADAGE